MGGAPVTTVETKLLGFARRPAIGAAVILIAGIVLHETMPDRPNAWLALSAAGAMVALGLWRFGAIATVALAIALGLLGIGVAQLEHYQFPSNDIVAYTTDTPRLAEVELEIDQPPRLITQDSPGGRPP